MEREQILNMALLPKVKVILRNGYSYTGIIQTVGDAVSIFIDKFGSTVLIENSEIVGIEEVKNA